MLTKIDQSQKNQGKEIRELFCNGLYPSSMVSDGMHGTPAGSPIDGCTSLGPSALKTATQVRGQHKYLIGDLKKSNICVDKHLLFLYNHCMSILFDDVGESVHQ